MSISVPTRLYLYLLSYEGEEYGSFEDELKSLDTLLTISSLFFIFATLIACPLHFLRITSCRRCTYKVVSYAFQYLVGALGPFG